MISVLFLIPTLDRGGAENVLVDLVNRMDQSIFHITVQTLFDQNSQKDRLKEGIEYRSFLFHQFHGNSRLFACIPARLLYKLIVGRRYDIVVSYLEGPTTHILSGCPYGDSKKVAWFHSALKTDRSFRAGFASKKEAICAYNGFDMIVFVAKTVQKAVEKIAGVQFKHTCILFNTINTEDILIKSKEELPKSLFSEKEINIVSIGKIAPVKGYDRLARVQKMLYDAGYLTHMYILGEGPNRKEIEAYLQKNGLSESFTFLGFQNNPYKFISKADLYVCSSHREGFSTAVCEALIVGIPVCTVEVSGMMHLLGENNEYGIITENNEEALYQGIKRLLDNPALLDYYHRQAEIRGREFSTNNTVKAVEEMFLRLNNENERLVES